MPTFLVTRFFGDRHLVTHVEAPTAGEAVGKAMADDNVRYEVHRAGRPQESYDLTPNGLRGRPKGDS